MPGGDPGVATYEAESATVTNAQVRTSGSASGGQFVGSIDTPGSSAVTFTSVYSYAGGAQTFRVYYGNAGSATATHTVSVNGTNAKTLELPVTGGSWGSFGQGHFVNITLNLAAGNNAVAFTAATNFAELDRIQPVNSSVYEAEDATVGAATVGADPSASNARYVRQIDNADSSITFSVTVPQAGKYTIRDYFANNSGASATHTVTLNGSSAGSITYPQSGGWGAFREDQFVDLNLTLAAGSNTLRLGKGTNFAEVDKVQMVPTAYEAEAATITHAAIGTSGTASGNKYVGQIDSSDSSISFGNVLEEGPAGQYTIRVYYANNSPAGANATHSLVVNNSAPLTVTYPSTGAWGSFSTSRYVDLAVSLQHGYNQLTFSHLANYAEIDGILLH